MFFSSTLGWGWLRDRFFPPTSRVQSIVLSFFFYPILSVFCVVFFPWDFFFIILWNCSFRETVWAWNSQKRPSAVTKRKRSYCKNHFCIVTFTVVCEPFASFQRLQWIWWDQLWSQVADLLRTDTFKWKTCLVTCGQICIITSDYTSCVRILSIDWLFYCLDNDVPLTTVETLRTVGLCLGFTCHFSCEEKKEVNPLRH